MVLLFDPGYLLVGDFALKLSEVATVCPCDMNESLCFPKLYGKMLALLIHNQNYFSFLLGQQEKNQQQKQRHRASEFEHTVLKKRIKKDDRTQMKSWSSPSVILLLSQITWSEIY